MKTAFGPYDSSGAPPQHPVSDEDKKEEEEN